MAKNKEKNIDLATFKQSISKMISTSEAAYEKYSYRKGSDFNHYTREQVLEIIDSGASDQLQEVSLFYSYCSGFYRRFLSYYATLLKYAYLLIPHMNGKNKIEEESSMKQYNGALSFIGQLGVKTLCRHIAYQTLVKGAYYGVLRNFGEDGYAVQDLPPRYCRSRYKNQAGVGVVELKLTYFDSIRDGEIRKEVLKGYPRTVRNAYNKFKNSGGSDWFMFEPEESLYFTLTDERPFFVSILPAIIDYSDYRLLEKEKDTQDLKTLLIQKLPIEDGELFFEPEEAEEIHRGSVQMLTNNRNTDVLTTYASVSLENMESNRSVVTNNLEKIEKSIFGEAGVSKELFAAEGNTALKHSITNDMSLMMVLFSQIANWLQYLVNVKFGNNKIQFKVAPLPISYYNETEMRKDALSLAQSGYSFLVPMVTFDLEQSDLTDLKNLEINALELNKIMIPLASSFTTSSGNPQQEDAKGGGEQNILPDDQKSDKTIQNIEAQS